MYELQIKFSENKKLFVHSGNLCGDAYQKTTAREEWLAGYVPEVKRYYENGEFLVAAGEDAIVDRSTARRGLLDTRAEKYRIRKTGCCIR